LIEHRFQSIETFALEPTMVQEYKPARSYRNPDLAEAASADGPLAEFERFGPLVTALTACMDLSPADIREGDGLDLSQPGARIALARVLASMALTG
jgi:hypothetical protein